MHAAMLNGREWFAGAYISAETRWLGSSLSSLSSSFAIHNKCLSPVINDNTHANEIKKKKKSIGIAAKP